MQVVDWLTKQTGKFVDNFKQYKFFVKAEPDSDLDSSTTLSLTVFTSRDQTAVVPCVFKWSRMKNGVLSEIPEFRGSSYICQPSDVGCIIQVQISCIDGQHPGTATLRYGPVKLDVLLKRAIETALATGNSLMHIDLVNQQQVRACELRIGEDTIRISHCNSNSSYKFHFNLAEPLFDVLPKDPTRVVVFFNEKFQIEVLKFISELFGYPQVAAMIDIRFAARKAKDEFLFVMKAFNAKKEIRSSAVIHKIERVEHEEENFNFLLEIESLKDDLKKLGLINQRNVAEKRTYFEESKRLEQEIEQIIVSYTTLIEGKFRTKKEFEQSFIDFESKKDEAISHKYRKIEQENERLKTKLNKILSNQEQFSLDLRHQDLKQDYLSTPPPKSSPFSKKQNTPEFLREQEDLFKPILPMMDLSAEKLQCHLPKHEQQLIEQSLELNKSGRMSERQKRQPQHNGHDNQSMRVQQNYNRSIHGGNMTALEISTSKVVQEKIDLERKYKQLKEDYSKLSMVCHDYRTDKSKVENNPSRVQVTSPRRIEETKSLALGQPQSVPEQINDSDDIKRLQKQLEKVTGERDELLIKIEFLNRNLDVQREQKTSQKSKLEVKIRDLNNEVAMLRRNHEVLNRSQHMSMQMDQYNEEQNATLKTQNQYLVLQIERLTQTCDKYKLENKKLKQAKQTTIIEPQQIVVPENTECSEPVQ